MPDAGVLPQRHGFGGNNGFTDFKDILGFDLHQDSTRVVLVVLVGARAAAAISRAGRSSRRARDGCACDPRCREPHAVSRLSGRVVQALAVVFSRAFAGVAGALYVPQVGIINPSEFSPLNSIEVVIWVAVGDVARCTAPRSARSSVNYAEDVSHRRAAEVWLYALGALFVL
jgi:urea transport system permease protein